MLRYLIRKKKQIMVRTKQTRKAQPYDELDLFRPATEGRSLHDDANLFYREIMEIETPINPNNLPKSKDVQKAILQIPREKKLPIFFSIYSLLNQRNFGLNLQILPVILLEFFGTQFVKHGKVKMNYPPNHPKRREIP